MARRGETIEYPLSGERMTFLETTGDTDGRFFEFEFVAPPGWAVAAHIHPRQEERTEILSGMLDGVVAGGVGVPRHCSMPDGSPAPRPASLPLAEMLKC